MDLIHLNKRGISKYMDTKNTIKKTLFRILEEHSADMLSVKLVCKEAGISKQTLYNHYYSVMDALEDAYRSEFNRAIEETFSTCVDWEDGFKSLLEFLNGNKKVFLHIYYSTYRDEFIKMIEKYGSTLIRNAINAISAEIGVSISNRDRDFMTKFYMYVFMGIIRDFLNERMEESPGFIAERCHAMMKDSMRNSIRNIHYIDKSVF